MISFHDYPLLLGFILAYNPNNQSPILINKKHVQNRAEICEGVVDVKCSSAAEGETKKMVSLGCENGFKIFVHSP